MHLIIGGDLVPTKSNLDIFNNGDVTSLLGDKLLSLWQAAEDRIFNLETPLTDIESPIDKCGPNLIAPTKSVNGIKALNPTLLTLANNHILDQGIQGLKSTESVLTKNEIPYVGIGNNLSLSNRPYLFKKNNCTIGIYACAEHEFSIATENSPGANPFDPLESLDHIVDLKLLCDYVIVLYHGGKEHYRYPSPYLQKVCRKMVKKGADLIVCQHSHCIGCFEKYRGSTIIYGQGNFIFDKSDNELWKTSILIKVTLNAGLTIEYIPIVKAGNVVRLATGEIAEDIIEAFRQRSDEILKEDFIEQQYLKFAEECIPLYLRRFSGFGKWMSRLDRRLLNGVLLKRSYSKTDYLAIRNYIECEAHRELALVGLRVIGKV